MPDGSSARIYEVAPNEADRSLDGLARWIKTRIGLDFDDDDRREVLRSRLEGLCRREAISLAELQRRLARGERGERGDESLAVLVAEAVSTNHTAFFREAEMFDYFAERILPTYAGRDVIRLWSAASSSGEEAFSMALCALRVFGDEAATRVRILGTDISAGRVRRAEAAVFAAAQIAEAGAFAPDLAAAFEPMPSAPAQKVRLAPRVSSLCTFRRMNLAQFPWPFAHAFDVVFLRNVLYYFEPELRERIVEACWEATSPGGWLVTSLTEPMLELRTRWVRLQPGIYRKGLR